MAIEKTTFVIKNYNDAEENLKYRILNIYINTNLIKI